MINAKHLGLTANQLAETASKLEAENAELRELAALRSAIFKHQTENAELRKLAVLQSVIFKHMSTCPTTDCKACPVNEECAESVHLEGVLGIDDKETSWLVQWRSEDAADVRAENAKLRELVRDYESLTATLCNERECDGCPFDSKEHAVCEHMRLVARLGELEIEASA